MMRRLIALSIAAWLTACSLVLDWDSREAPGVPDDAAVEVDAGAVDAAPPVFECPSTRGPRLVRAGTYCIDSTEVTNAHYLEFLASKPDAATQSAVCAWNVNLEPGGTWPPPAERAQLPVVDVDWCDALAYCTWAGKRLCGSSSTLADAGPGDAGTWYLACSNGGTRKYPYGDTFDAEACRSAGASGGNDTLGPVGSLPTCVGGVPGLFDMAGNAAEWEDTCEDVPPGATPLQLRGSRCRVRGGSYRVRIDGLECDAVDLYGRAEGRGDRGIRCCFP